jgi:hypothetical protein
MEKTPSSPSATTTVFQVLRRAPADEGVLALRTSDRPRYRSPSFPLSGQVGGASPCPGVAPPRSPISLQLLGERKAQFCRVDHSPSVMSTPMARAFAVRATGLPVDFNCVDQKLFQRRLDTEAAGIGFDDALLMQERRTRTSSDQIFFKKVYLFAASAVSKRVGSVIDTPRRRAWPRPLRTRSFTISAI